MWKRLRLGKQDAPAQFHTEVIVRIAARRGIIVMVLPNADEVPVRMFQRVQQRLQPRHFPKIRVALEPAPVPGMFPAGDAVLTIGMSQQACHVLPHGVIRFGCQSRSQFFMAFRCQRKAHSRIIYLMQGPPFRISC